MRNREFLVADALSGEGCAYLIHRRGWAGDDGLGRRVHGGLWEVARVARRSRLDILFGCRNCRHGAACRQGRHQRSSACATKTNSVFQTENARHCRGDDFAYRMARDDARR